MLVSFIVATYAAMKSGLKDLTILRFCQICVVATYAAMKSGLKANRLVCTLISESCSNLCRDEKRTESNFANINIH